MVLSPDGKRALLTIRDDVKKVYAVYMGLFPTLEVQRVGLASPPIAAGVVADAGARVRRPEAPGRPHHLRHAGERRSAHAHRLQARLARGGLERQP